jgi:type I restriction enzyme S subunit
LGALLNKLTDGAHHTPKYTESGVPFLSVKDISSGKINLTNTKLISMEEHAELYKRCNPERGDILLTKVGTTGIPVLVDTDDEFSLFVSVALLKFDKHLLCGEYLVKLIESPLVGTQCTENTRGVGNKNWVMRDIANTLVVLPPIAEQRRIVEKIETLMLICNSL